MIEARANLSFDAFRLGRVYQLDGNDPRIQAQILGGYFTVINVLGGPDGSSADLAGLADSDAGGDLDSGMVRSPKKKKKVTDGEGEDRQPENDSLQLSENLAAG